MMNAPVTQQDFLDYQNKQDQNLSSFRSEVIANKVEQDRTATEVQRIGGIMINAEKYIGEMKDEFEKSMNKFKDQAEAEINQSRSQTQDVRAELQKTAEAANQRIFELNKADADTKQLIATAAQGLNDTFSQQLQQNTK